MALWLARLRAAKRRAVAAEDFAEAKRLKRQEEALDATGDLRKCGLNTT